MEAAPPIYPPLLALENMDVEHMQEHSYTRREIVIIIIIIVVAAFVIGNFNQTNQVVSGASSGQLSFTTNVICNGFGEPTYYSSTDQDNNVTTYQYGSCFFGFWVSNGQPVALLP
jgi:hypothetical protein